MVPAAEKRIAGRQGLDGTILCRPVKPCRPTVGDFTTTCSLVSTKSARSAHDPTKRRPTCAPGSLGLYACTVRALCLELGIDFIVSIPKLLIGWTRSKGAHDFYCADASREIKVGMRTWLPGFRHVSGGGGGVAAMPMLFGKHPTRCTRDGEMETHADMWIQAAAADQPWIPAPWRRVARRVEVVWEVKKTGSGICQFCRLCRGADTQHSGYRVCSCNTWIVNAAGDKVRLTSLKKRACKQSGLNKKRRESLDEEGVEADWREEPFLGRTGENRFTRLGKRCRKGKRCTDTGRNCGWCGQRASAFARSFGKWRREFRNWASGVFQQRRAAWKAGHVTVADAQLEEYDQCPVPAAEKAEKSSDGGGASSVRGASAAGDENSAGNRGGAEKR